MKARLDKTDRRIIALLQKDGRMPSSEIAKQSGVSEATVRYRLKKLIEEQFIQTQRMEFLATLAGGVAHYFNNILMGIQGNISLMLLGKTPDHTDYNKLVKEVVVKLWKGKDAKAMRKKINSPVIASCT